jgi:mannosyltransferase
MSTQDSTLVVPPRTSAPPQEVLARAGAFARRAALPALALAVLAGVALWVRWKALGAPFWIDEGISVGLASHPVHSIPGLLRIDGSPPLYYLLLHWWMAGFGRSAAATHSLSMIFAVLSAPASAWAAGTVFGRRAALAAGVLAAFSPFLGLYADETRMYSLVFLLAALATGAFLNAYVLRRRAFVPVFAAALAASLYTHGWALFLGGAFGLALIGLLAAGPDRRGLLIDGVLGFGAAALVFAPWLPTVLFQAHHTGAPWSHAPSWRGLGRALSRIVGGNVPETLAFTVAGAGAAVCAWRDPGPQRRAMGVLLVVSSATLLAGFAASNLATPAWALRYLVIVLAPGIILLGAGLARAGVGGLAVAAVIVVGYWAGKPTARTLEHKSNVSLVAQRLSGRLPRGTVVASIQPEQVPVLHYYLPDGLRYMTPLGRVTDPTVMDWRDAMTRMRKTSPRAPLRRTIAALLPGERLLLVRPLFHKPTAPWTRTIRRRGRLWRRLVLHDHRLAVLASVHTKRGSNRSEVSAILLERRRGRP